MQFGWPKQGVKTCNILADEVIELAFTVGFQKLVKINLLTVTVILEAGEIANRGIEPDVKILVFLVRNFKAPVWRISGNIPFKQFFAEQFLLLVCDFLLRMPSVEPVCQKVPEVFQLEK